MTRAELHGEVLTLFAALRAARDRDEDIPREAWVRLSELSHAGLEGAEIHLAATRQMLSRMPGGSSRALADELKRSPARS